MSHTRLICHYVFGTKGRTPFINNALRSDLHAYMGGIIRNLKGAPIEINGVEDHVHVLTTVPPTIDVATFAKKLKANSSLWAGRRTQGRFAWQQRYGAFSVSHSQVNVVRDYVRRQEEHHKTISFRAEYMALLRKHQIEFDEDYLFS